MTENLIYHTNGDAPTVGEESCLLLVLAVAGGLTLSPYSVPHCPLLSGLCLRYPARTVREQTLQVYMYVHALDLHVH